MSIHRVQHGLSLPAVRFNALTSRPERDFIGELISGTASLSKAHEQPLRDGAGQ